MTICNPWFASRGAQCLTTHRIPVWIVVHKANHIHAELLVEHLDELSGVGVTTGTCGRWCGGFSPCCEVGVPKSGDKDAWHGITQMGTRQVMEDSFLFNLRFDVDHAWKATQL